MVAATRFPGGENFVFATPGAARDSAEMAQSAKRDSLAPPALIVLGLGLLIGASLLMLEARSVATNQGVVMSGPLQFVVDHVVARLLAGQPDAPPVQHARTLHTTLFAGAAIGLVLTVVGAVLVALRRRA